MSYKSLYHFIEKLESEGELLRIKEFVNPELEIAEIADRFVKSKGKALLFENAGTGFPLLINAFASEKRMCLALGVNDLDDIGKEMEEIFKNLTVPVTTIKDKIRLLPKLKNIASWMPGKAKGKAACHENIIHEPDLNKLPILKCWPFDGGRFITLPAVHTIDPENGLRNVGMYRMQVFEKNMTGMHWHLHKGSASHFQKYKELGKKMPVSVVLGGDPVYTYVSTAPLPENVDEYMLAGFLRKKKVELTKCITNDIVIPTDADIVIEGYVDPTEDLIWEGPFGDHTGYYSLEDYYPKFHVTCITHRNNAVYPATIVGIPPMEDEWLGKATERIFLTPIRMSMLPEIKDMVMPVEGVFHNIALVKINQSWEGQAAKVMNSLWGAGQMMFNKIMLVTNQDIDLNDYEALAKFISDNVDPLRDIFQSKGPADVLDHAVDKFAFGGKMGIDATGYRLPVTGYKFQKNQVTEHFEEIIDISDHWLGKGISVAFISVKKFKDGHIRLLHHELLNSGLIENVKFIIYCEDKADLNATRDVVWRFANNFDPARDVYFADDKTGNKIPCAGLDGTRKYKELDSFQRLWPNIVTMDKATIEEVDKKWSSWGLGEFIKSPSLKYIPQLYGGKAMAEE